MFMTEGVQKVPAEDLMTMQQPGILPCGHEPCRSHAIPCVASGWRVFAVEFPKTGIITEE